MSDNERNAPDGDEVGLPRATVNKLIQGDSTLLDLLPSASPTSDSSCTFRAELLPPETVVSKDTKELLAECCKGKRRCSVPCARRHELNSKPDLVPEFITLISSEANEICEKEAKKTISPEHITAALKVRSC